VDTGDDEHSTDMAVRLIEDVSDGKEICISYFRIGRRIMVSPVDVISA